MNSDPDKQLAHAYVERHDSLGPLAGRAAELIEIRRRYRENIPVGLAQVSEILNFRRGVVVIAADHSAAAAKLKQLTPRLLAMFLERGWQVTAIQVQVQASGSR